MYDVKYLGSRTGVYTGDFNDVSFTNTGDLDTVSGSGRLKQDVVKILLTEQGLMPYPNYGTQLSFMRNVNPNDTRVLSDVADEVESALRYLDALEPSTDLSERIGEITSLETSYADSAISILLNITTAERTTIDLNFLV